MSAASTATVRSSNLRFTIYNMFGPYYAKEKCAWRRLSGVLRKR